MHMPIRSFLVRLFYAALIVLCTTGLRWLDEAYLVWAFEQIALRSEYKPGESQILRKWVQPVRVYIDSRMGFEDIQTRLVDEHLSELRQLIALPIQRVQSRSDANMVILFERSSRLYQTIGDYYPEPPFPPALLAASVCLARMHSRPSGEIVRVFIAIPPDKARQRRKLPACVVEEITQGLGLPNDSDEVYPSVFNDRSVDERLSPVDKLLLRILYDPRLRPGMSSEVVRPLVRRIVRERLPAMRERFKPLIEMEERHREGG